MGYKVVWDEKKQRYVPAKGESTAKKETYSWSSYKANNKSSKSGKKSNDTVDPIKTALGNAQNALNTNPGERNIQKLPNYTGGSTFQYLSNDLTPGVAGARDYNRFSTNLPKYEGEYLKNVYKPGGGKTLQIQNSANKFGVIARNSEGAAQDIIAEADSLGLSDDDIKLIQKQALELAKVASEYENKARARTGDASVIDNADNWKKKQKLQGLYNLSGYDKVPGQLATNVPDDFKRDGIATYQDLYNKQLAYSRDQMEKDLKTIDSFYNARYAMPGMRFDAEAEQEFADAVSRYEEYSGVDLTNMPADYDGKWIKRMMSSYDADTDMLRGVVEGSEGNWDFDDVYNRDKALLDEQRQKEQADAKGKKFEAEAGEMEAAVQNTEGYADKSQYIPGTQYWMPGSDDYNILAGGSMPSPEDTTSWEERNNRVRYSFINDFLAAVEAKDDATISDMREIAGNLGALYGYDLDAMTNMDEDQIKTAFAYINGNNYQGFEDYMRKINYDLSRKSYEKWEEAEQLKAQGRNFWEHMGASITTWPQNVLASVSGLTNDISAWLEKFGIDIRDPYLEHEFSNYNRWGAGVDIIRGGADQYIRDNTWSLPENIPVVGGFNPLGTLYQGAMSLGDVGLARLAGDWLGGSLGLAGKAAKKFSQFVSGLHMFGIEAGRSLQEAMAAGQDNAALKATGDATLSAIFENIGLDKVLSGNLLKAAIGEGSEEFFTGATQMVWDALLNREDSKPAKLLDKYRIMGYASKAEFAAALDTAADLFEQFMSGFSAGGVGGVTPAVTNQVQNVKAGRTIQQFDTAQPILDLAATLDLEPSVLQLVQEQQAALDAMKASQQESEAQSEEDQDNLDDEAAIESEEEDQEAEVLPERGEYEFGGNESTLTPVGNEQEAEKLPNREESQPDGRESTLTPANEQQAAEKLSERETTMPDGESTLTPASEENAPAAEETEDVSEAAEDMAEAAEDAAENPAPKKRKKVKVPKVSNAKLGRIYREALAKLDERAQDVLRKSFETEISQQLQERGFKGDPKATAEAISKMVSGDASMITPEVVMAVSSDRMVLEIVNDFTAPIRDFQRMAALGAGGIPAIAAKNVKGKYSTANGQRFVPERIVSISDDGKVRVTGKTVHGEVMTVDADSIDFGINDGGIEIVADVAGILGRNADALLNNMQGSQDPVKYALAFKAAMEYGQNGRSLSSAKSDTSLSTLTESQIEIAHSLGKDILEKGGRKPKKNISGISVGNVDTSAISGIKLSKQQKASINAMTRLAKVVGFNVKFVKSKADADGKYKTENGSWESSTMTLTLDIHAGSNKTTDLNYAMMHTAGHELTHFIKDFADAGLWNDYQEFVMDHLYEKMSDAEIEERIKDHIKRAEKRGETMTRDGALEEVIADASGEALMNITESDLRQIAQSNPTLFGRIKQFFKKWLSDLKTNIDIAYSGNQNKTAETKAMHDVVDQLSEKWNKMLINAAQNRNVASEATSEAIVVTADGAVVSKDVAAIMESDAYAKPDNSLFSLRETDAWAESHKNLYPNDTNFADNLALIQDFDRRVAADSVLRYLVPHGKIPKTVRGPLRNNQEYVYTFDMDTKCERTYQFLAYRDAVQKRIGRQLTENEARSLIELMRAYGQMIPCTYCYVEGKRMKLAELYMNYLKKNSESIMGAQYSAEQVFDIVEGARSIVSGYLDNKFNVAENYELDATLASEGFEGYRDFMMPISETEAAEEIFERYNITDKAAKRVVQGFIADWVYNRRMDLPMNLVNTEADFRIDSIDEKVLAFHDLATKAAQGGAKAKGIENYEPYVDQLKNVSVEDKRYMVGMGGIRKHSSNDFQIQNVQDYMLFFMDLAADKRGGIDWTGHTYTKNLDYARIFAPTNDRINVSIAMYGDDASGIRPNTQEGVNWDELKQIRKQYKNVGAMAMVVNNDQLSFALNSDWVDMIIPFHASGMKRSLYYDVLAWTDYTSKQGERLYNKGQMIAKLRDKGIKVNSSAKAADVQRMFMETFSPKSLISEKTGKRVAPHFFPGETIQHGQVVPGHNNDAKRYFELCEQYATNPRFFGIKVKDADGNLIDVTQHPAYLKLIKETARTDSKQEPIVAKFDMEYANKAIENFQGYSNLSEDAYGIVDEFVREYIGKNRKVGYLTDRAIETRDIINEMAAAEQKKRASQRTAMLENINNAARLNESSDAGFYDDGKRYSERVTDEDTLDFLNNQETVTTYKTMQLVDGKLYPPMAAVVAGSYEDASELGTWEQATEHPELIKLDKKGKPQFTLNKGKGKGSLQAAYNPYMHSSNLVLNDQFSGAYDRPNLVTVECEVPASELTSGYRAQHAKDTVGWHAWHTGTVAGALRKSKGIERQVLLSRWIKPVRIVPDSEVAAKYKELLDGTGVSVPDNVVPPSLLKELKKAGVKITESGRVPKVDAGDVRYQERDFSELSDRELLANAVESVAQNDTERDYIKRYKKHIAELNEKQLAMQEAEEQIRELKAEDAKGNRDEIIKLQNKVDIYAKQISRADAKLLDYEATTPIKDMLTREKAEYKRKRDAKAKEQMARYRENQHQRTLDRIREVREAEANKRKAMRERADERQRKAVEHAREVGQRKVDRMKESQGKEKYRAQILQDAKKLYGWVVSPTNKGHVPAFLREPLAGFIESIDFTSARQLKGGDPTKNDAKFEKALDKLRDAIGDINKQQSDIDGGAATFAGYIDLPSDYMDEFNTLVRNIKTTLEISEGAVDTPFNRMTADQLHEMSKMFRILNSSISKMNQLVANGRYESAKTASNDTIADMNAMNAKVKTNKVLSTLNTMFNWKNTTPYYAFQRLGRGGKAIFEGLQDGWDKMAQNSKKLIEYAEDAFTSQQAKEWSKDIKTIELDSGEKFQMTASQAMSLYCLSKRQQAIGHLKGGGIRVSDIDAGKGNTISQVDNYILSEGDISRIIGTLTAEQKGVADKLQRFMNTVCTEWGNEISMKRFGYEMFTEDNYFPIETDANNRSRIDDKQDGNNSMFRLLNMSAMKQLTPNANNAIIIRDIFDVFSNHASDIGKYNALALPILDFIKWYNFVEKSEVLDANGKPTGQIITRSTQKALERAFGQDAKTYLMSFIKDLNAEHDGGRNDTVLSKLMGHAKAGSVSANMRVAFLQITSLPRAAYAIDPKYLLKGMAKVKSLNPATAIKGSEAQENVGILKWKNLGFYSTDVSRSTRSMVRRDEGVITKIRDLVMKPAEWGDNWTSNIIYEAAKAEMADKHPNAKPGTKAYDAMLNKRVREIVYKTQVVDSTMTRSDFMRSKGLMTAFTAFMSEPTLTVNMLNESIQEAVANARTGMSARENLRSVGGKAVRAATVMAVTATAAALVESLFDALRDDDDYEEFQEKFADAFGGNIVDNVNVFAMLPLIKDAISVMQGYENSSMVTQVVSQYKDVQEAITAWQEGKRPIYSVIYNMLKVAASATGVGVQSATRDAVGLYNTFLADAFDTPKIQTYSDSKSKAAEEFYEALQAGDEEKVEWIMQRAEINGIALPDISDKIATLVKNEFVAGDITEEEATRRLIEYGGKDENEAYWKIQEWGYSGEGNFSKYTGLKDALKSGDRAAANAARDELVEHGASEQAISGQLSEIYNNGEATSILNLQMRSDSLYTSSLKLKADGEAHPDDFDAFITAIVNGGNISGEIDALMDKGYTVKQCMSAINGAFGKSKDTYRIMETNNSSDAGILLDRILDAYEYLGLDRAEEIAWIDANWIM